MNGQMSHHRKKGVHHTTLRRTALRSTMQSAISSRTVRRRYWRRERCDATGRAMRSETYYFFLFRRRPRRGRTDVARAAACTQVSRRPSSRRFARRRWKDGMNDASNPFVDVDAVRSGNTARMISREYRAGDLSDRRRAVFVGSASTGRRRRSVIRSLFGVVSRRRVDGWGSAAVWVNSYMNTPL